MPINSIQTMKTVDHMRRGKATPAASVTAGSLMITSSPSTGTSGMRSNPINEHAIRAARTQMSIQKTMSPCFARGMPTYNSFWEGGLED